MSGMAVPGSNSGKFFSTPFLPVVTALLEYIDLTILVFTL